ncbi:hypothetical protein BC828DRAFT_440333 [Blastocladiella britannica]|nr:hypothetical protein BC828DRAFT_440333 [Blastocladiella britannica]
MSASTKHKKHAIQSYLASDPTPLPGQVVAHVVANRGNNLHLVRLPDGTETLAEMPPRFRNVIWVKRDSYVVFAPVVPLASVTAPGVAGSNKIGGEIAFVLYAEHIAQLRRSGHWPSEFELSASSSPGRRSGKGAADKNSGSDGQSDDDNDDDDELFRNPNRGSRASDSSSSSESSDSDGNE